MLAVSCLIVLASMALAKTISVDIGNAGLKIEPNVVFADKGDIISFEFYPGNHSVAQANFDKPSQPLVNGFYSGYIDSASDESATKFELTVNDTTTPLWYYCSQQQHCQAGMVAVINPSNSSDQNQAAFAAAAKNAPNNAAPSNGPTGGVLTTDASDDDSGSSSSSSASAPSATSSASVSNTVTPTASAAASSGAASSNYKVSDVSFVGGLGLLFSLGML
ncbi:hypothetical protein MMC09_003993 [Bachmanniomyces sp. S44760]|nr:hypothetical protein [Bachmanniomyces sp. S44760]